MTFTLEQVQNVAFNCLLVGFAAGVGLVLFVEWLIDRNAEKREGTR